MSQNQTKPLFSLGRIVATPGALESLRDAGQAPGEFLARHASGDWGDLDGEDKGLNDAALVDGSRILSAFEEAERAGPGADAERVSQAASFGALMGASGNSGVITSQILAGMAHGLAADAVLKSKFMERIAGPKGGMALTR